MYIERKAGHLTDEARIGRVTFSRTGSTIYYRGRTFQSLKGRGFKANYYELSTGEEYWISGCKKGGGDRMDYDHAPVRIDEDVREEYWTMIRNRQDAKARATF